MRTSAALAAAATFLVGCSSPPKVNACQLLSVEDLADVLEVRVTPGERNDDGITVDGAYSSTCAWNILMDEDPGQFGRRLVILNAMDWPRGSDPDKFLNAFSEALDAGVLHHPPVPLEIGDRSFWWGDGVAVRQQRTTFGISIMMRDAAPDWKRERSEQLAARILERL